MVQTAVDVYMAVNNYDTVTASTTYEKAGDDADDSLQFDSYLRRSTRFYVAWDASGNVLTACEDSACGGTDDPLWTQP
jgi:hypothetical protein